MSKNIHEPSIQRSVAVNRYNGQMTQQKPYAFEWATPINDADCPPNLTIYPAWTPCYLNGWEQPTTLEPLSVRLRADGSLQWKGYVNSQNSTNPIAFIMPGTLPEEPDLVPPDSPGNLSYNVFTTPDDGVTITSGRAYVDSATGEVSIYPITVSAGIVYHHKVFADDQIVLVGDGRRIFAIPQDMAGFLLTDVEIDVTTVSSSGIVQVQIRNITQALDILSTRVQIDVSEFHSKDSATQPVVSFANSDVAHGDRIAIDVDAAGANAKGLGVVLYWSSA